MLDQQATHATGQASEAAHISMSMSCAVRASGRPRALEGPAGGSSAEPVGGGVSNMEPDQILQPLAKGLEHGVGHRPVEVVLGLRRGGGGGPNARRERPMRAGLRSSRGGHQRHLEVAQVVDEEEAAPHAGQLPPLRGKTAQHCLLVSVVGPQMAHDMHFEW